MSLRKAWVYRIYLSTIDKSLLDSIVKSISRVIKDVSKINVIESNVVNDFYLVEIYSKSHISVQKLEEILNELKLTKNNYKIDSVLVKTR